MPAKEISILIGLFLLCSTSLFSQIKFEREYRLGQEDVPERALDFIEVCQFEKPVKWYKEESQDGQSVEAKLKHKGKRYSIEFDTLGFLQDIEIQIKESQIFSPAKEKMQEYLAQSFSKFSFIKVQLQLSGNPKDLISLMRAEGRIEGFTQKFEVIVKGKKEKTNSLYEILFNDQGVIERIDRIKTRNTDNMDF